MSLIVKYQWSTYSWWYSSTPAGSSECGSSVTVYSTELCPDIWKTTGKGLLWMRLWWTKCNNVLPGEPFQMKNVIKSPRMFLLRLGSPTLQHPASANIVQMVAVKHYDWVQIDKVNVCGDNWVAFRKQIALFMKKGKTTPWFSLYCLHNTPKDPFLWDYTSHNQ